MPQAAYLNTLRKPVKKASWTNAAGGSSTKLDRIDQVRRFLILGSEDGTYYTGEYDHTEDNAKNLHKAIKKDGLNVVISIVWAADNAPKRNAVNYATACVLAYGDTKTKQFMVEMFPKVFKTGTDLFEFLSYVTKMRGWGNALRNGVRDFINGMDLDHLALWMVKYRSRHGWTWDDVLRVTHPYADNELRNNLYHSITQAEHKALKLPDVMIGYLNVQRAEDASTVLSLVDAYRLPWEALTDEQRTPLVWEGLLPGLGDVALVRNLANLTRKGLLEPFNGNTSLVVERLGKVHLHPVKLYDALLTYTGRNPNAKSRGVTFAPNGQVVSALEKAVSESFGRGAEPTGKNFLLAVDTSGSMGGTYAYDNRTEPIEQALVIAKSIHDVETNVHSIGVNTVTHSLNLNGSWATVRKAATPGGGTNLALPFEEATRRNLNVDVFVVITDNESWAHSYRYESEVSPEVAFNEYRHRVNPDAKVVVVALTATRSSIVDSADPAALNIAGWSADTVEVINAFAQL